MPRSFRQPLVTVTRITSGQRLIWINGPFGAGKTSVARALLDLRPHAFLIDPEILGVVFGSTTPTDACDYQDLPAWRELVIASVEILQQNGSELVVMPMAVLRRAYFNQLAAGFRASGSDVVHVVLDVSPTVLEARIAADTADPAAAPWRRQKLSAYPAARQWLAPAADLWLVTDNLPATGAAAEIDRLLG